MGHEAIRRREGMRSRRIRQASPDADLSSRPEVVAWTIDGDANGKPLVGSNRYVLHFDAGREPPAHGFWSLVMHDERCLPTADPIRPDSVGDRGSLSFDADGALDVFVSHDPPPGDRRANWLPAPRGPFHLVLNIYWPRPEVLSGNWLPPPIRPFDPWPDA
ncbi:MAG TPA: DUF1214 domain-containing protein [Vicinamibacterales bacterium]|nr:DUF1214 domain-containing protein [Vicinamibacterales bacterium]